VLGDVGHAFLQHQVDLAPHVGAELEIVRPFRSVEGQIDIGAAERVLGEAAHAVHEIAERIGIRVHGPDDVAHGVHEGARGLGNPLERIRQLGAAVILPLPRDLGQDRNLRQTRADIVVQVRGDPRPDAFDAHQLRNASAICQETDRPDDSAGQRDEPPSGVDRRQHREGDDGGCGAGDVVRRDCPDEQAVRA
jgi:hypothetical protein